jgi:serine/threonine-protein kinase RsbW
VSLAARLDFTIDDIEDLRIAVGEASAMVLPSADAGSDLVCRYYMRPGEVSINVEVHSADPHLPEEDSFAWQVLSALTTQTSTSYENGIFSVTLTMNSTVNV